MPAPLDGFRVLDLTLGPAGGMATMVLADFGADVVKVEPPGGDPFRALANAPLWLRGKRSVILDLADPAGRLEAGRLARAADVLVTTLTADQCRRFDLEYEALETANPGLVYCRLSGFGPRGPYAGYPGYEGVVAAKSGRMLAFAGTAAREGPSYAAVQLGIHASAQSALAAVLAALLERETSGRGQLVETSLLQSLLAYDLLGLVRTELLRRSPPAFENDPILAAGLGPTLNYHPLPTADGRWLQMGNLLQHLFDNFLMAAGFEDVIADPRYQGPPAAWDEADREAFRDRMLLHMKRRTAAEWMRIFIEHGSVAATEYRTTQEAMDDPDLVDNGHVVEQDHPRLGKVLQLGLLARLSETPGSVGAPSREPGADTGAVASLWPGERRRVVTRQGAQRAANRSGPLAGKTILEFATIIAAPLSAAILGDLGARIIKVEPIGGDPYRALGLYGIMASKTNASKESIAIDLKSAEGQEIVQRLVRKADAVIHNYRPGVPERLGVSYEQCAALRPGIVYVSMNGYGPLGPSAHRPATHPIPGAAVGGATLQAAGAHRWDADNTEGLRAIAWRLFRSNEANPDPNTSVVTASATLLALLAQERYGTGQQVFVDMMGANAYANADDFIRYEGKPERPWPDPDLHGLSATYRLYQTREGWVFLALLKDAEFTAFCSLTGAEHLARDERFSTASGRKQHDTELAAALSDLLAQRSADEWEALLAPRGLGCVRADGTPPGEFWLDDPHVRENGFVTTVEHARYGRHTRWGTLSTFHRTSLSPGPGALAGDATRSILQELGYSDERIEALYARNLVWSEPVARLDF